MKNMETLKFRVWDGEQMISPDYITREGRAFWKENSIPTSSDKVMQFIGLKDWHKKEIYIGDIIMFEEKDGLLSEFFEVVKDMHTMYYHCWEKNVDYTDIKVVGNIYEHKKLIKKYKNKPFISSF